MPKLERRCRVAVIVLHLYLIGSWCFSNYADILPPLIGRDFVCYCTYVVLRYELLAARGIHCLYRVYITSRDYGKLAFLSAFAANVVDCWAVFCCVAVCFHICDTWLSLSLFLGWHLVSLPVCRCRPVFGNALHHVFFIFVIFDHFHAFQ